MGIALPCRNCDSGLARCTRQLRFPFSGGAVPVGGLAPVGYGRASDPHVSVFPICLYLPPSVAQEPLHPVPCCFLLAVCAWETGCRDAQKSVFILPTKLRSLPLAAEVAGCFALLERIVPYLKHFVKHKFYI
jgi:hypothetical protein